LRTFNTISVINFRAYKVLIAGRINKQSHTGFFDFGITFTDFFFKCKTILKPGATTASDKYAQF